ncbi:hypothetical protein [Streptomyces natalensis]|uniref:Uncharacterized protein n=1 Tax=Streptomyces natalensis ATCC 27448 TaxID=1240678 RepID=A0A0D7CKJ9_9ACTN|nr:hypothetical protein [Streptomyces natalensis]KIZ16380.1 hypothetical protein SNA_20215 [Streptomyces natalensis ATCC 27448]
MTSAEVRSGTREDIDEVTEILTDAFAEGRLYQWMFTTQELHRRPAPGYFGWVVEENLEVGEVFLCEDIGGLLLSHLASKNPGQSAYAAPPCSRRTRHATGSRLPRCGMTSDLDLNPRVGARRQDDVVGDGSPHSYERAATAEMCGARRKVNTAQVEAA